MYLILAEFELRAQRGDLCETLTEQARVMAEWLRVNHSGNPQPLPKSIANGIRAAYNATKRA